MNLLVHAYIFISNRHPNRFLIYTFGYEVDVRSIVAMCCFFTGKIFIDMKDLVHLLNLIEEEQINQILFLI